jgi:hypothetical protein
MDSELAAAEVVVHRGTLVRVMALLRSQGLGVALGQLTVLLLAVGSVVLVATSEGASQNVSMDDLRAFFVEPSWAHLWLYALVPVMSLYALNTFLGTVDEVMTKWEAGLRSPRAYAATLLHVGFLFALLAHLVGGVLNEEGRPVMIGGTFVALGEGRAARVVSLELPRLPTGALEQAYATLEVRDADGSTHTELVSYNAPLSRGLGSELFILAKQGNPAQPMVMLRHRHAPGNPIALVGALLMAAGTLLMWRRFV